MVVELRPVEEVDINQEIQDFVTDVYCANCTHVDMQATEDAPYCTYWDEPTRIKSGLICPEYRPQGFETR